MLATRREKQISKWLIISCFLAFSFLMFSYGAMRSNANLHRAKEEVNLTVQQGMTADEVAQLLYDKGVTDSVLGFKLIAKINRLDESIKAGEYVFDAGMSYQTIVERLANGQTSMLVVRLTIPEGYTVKQIGALLEKKGISSNTRFMQLAEQFAPYAYMKGEDDVEYQAEGFLFPDTYEFMVDETAERVLQVLSEEFDSRFSAKLRERADELGLTLREVVILASLVEKEAQVDEDRPVIAQVFLNRLQMNMPLQSCATIQYILGYPKPELTIEDTRIASPYNTYLHLGLPPGPIANPGIASIEAVLYSEPTEYLYFVADQNGKHHFSTTYDEHLQTIDRIE